MRNLIALMLSLLALPAFAQTAPQPAPVPAANPRVALETSAGRIVVEVFADKAPITAANFLKYVDQKRLDGIDFYRIVKVQDGFGFVQFGVNGDYKRVLPPIRHEPTTQTGLKHIEGTLSMPRLAPGTAQGEFTIAVGDQSYSFDANPANPGDNLGYAAFARVTEGMDVVVRILDAPISPTATIRGSFKGEVPVAPVKVITARRIR